MSHVGKTFLSVIAITLAILCKLTPVQAGFSALQDQGGILATDPSCALGNNFGKAATCGVVGVTGHLYANRFNGSGFIDLGGLVIRKPSCTNFGGSFAQALCGVIGLDSSVFVTSSSPFQNDPSWSGLQSIGGVSISDPACTGPGQSAQAICAIIGPNSSLAVAMTTDGLHWTAFVDLNLGGTHIFNPTCTFLFPQGALCGAVTTAGELRVKFFNGTTWDPNPTIIPFPSNSFISITSDPSCTFAGPVRQVICGVRGSDNALYVSQLNGLFFPQFQSLGGILAGAPSCTSPNYGGTPTLMAVCAVRGINSELYVNQFNNGTWSGFQPIPGAIISGDPSCTLVVTAIAPSPAVWCGVRSTNSELWVTIGP
jgi:hypothetical protein